MKKSLLTLAALSAIAGAAQAQSSVTVFGILDVGYVGGQSTVNSSAITATNGQTKATYSQRVRKSCNPVPFCQQEKQVSNA